VVWVCASSAEVNVLAQTGGGGSIQGTITDPGGAVVLGATVVATNVATSVETTNRPIGGKLTLTSKLGQGTELLVEVPL